MWLTASAVPAVFASDAPLGGSEAPKGPPWGDWIWFAEGDLDRDAPPGARFFRRSFDVPPGVPKVAGRELQDWFRPFGRSELVPYARFDFIDLDHIPRSGPAIVVANHRSYFDVIAMSLVTVRVGRPGRFLGKREEFDAPVIGPAARWW